MSDLTKSKIREILEQIFFFAVVVFIFWLIFKKVPVQKVLVALKKVEPVRFFSLSFIFVWTSLALDSFIHYFLFNKFQIKINYKDMFEVRLASMLLGSLGFVYGQGGLSWLVSRETKRPIAEVVGLLAFLFFNTFFSAVLFALIAGGVFLPKAGGEKIYFKIFPALLGGVVLFFIWLVFWKSRFKNKIPLRLRKGILYGFDQAPVKRYFQLIALRTIWFLILSTFVWLAMPAIDIHIEFKVLASLIPVLGIIIAFPTPGRYGTHEGGYLLLFSNWADGSKLVAFALLWGTSANILRAIFSLLAVRRYRKK